MTTHETPIGFYQNGVRTLAPSSKKGTFNIAQLFSLPYCLYFSNLKSETQLINQHALETCGYLSEQEAKGKTIEHVATAESAQRVIQSHRESMLTHKVCLIEDDIVRKDAINFQSLSIIRPWYTQENVLTGIFGISIVLNENNPFKALNELISLGLLNNKPLSKHGTNRLAGGFLINGIYLSKRETQCIRYYIRGITVKKIANILQLSPRTIEHYLENIKNKIGVSSRADLINYILEHTQED